MRKPKKKSHTLRYFRKKKYTKNEMIETKTQ